MALRTVGSRPSVGSAWLTYTAVGALMLTWATSLATVLMRVPSGLGTWLWCLCLSGCGFALTAVGLKLGATPGPAAMRDLRGELSKRRREGRFPGLRLDRPQPYGSRSRRPHCRFPRPE